MKEILEIIKKRVESAELSGSEMTMSFIEKQIIISLIDSALSAEDNTILMTEDINHWVVGQFESVDLLNAIKHCTRMSDSGIRINVIDFEYEMVKLTKGKSV